MYFCRWYKPSELYYISQNYVLILISVSGQLKLLNKLQLHYLRIAVKTSDFHESGLLLN